MSQSSPARPVVSGARTRVHLSDRVRQSLSQVTSLDPARGARLAATLISTVLDTVPNVQLPMVPTHMPMSGVPSVPPVGPSRQPFVRMDNDDQKTPLEPISPSYSPTSPTYVPAPTPTDTLPQLSLAVRAPTPLGVPPADLAGAFSLVEPTMEQMTEPPLALRRPSGAPAGPSSFSHRCMICSEPTTDITPCCQQPSHALCALASSLGHADTHLLREGSNPNSRYRPQNCPFCQNRRQHLHRDAYSTSLSGDFITFRARVRTFFPDLPPNEVLRSIWRANSNHATNRPDRATFNDGLNPFNPPDNRPSQITDPQTLEDRRVLMRAAQLAREGHSPAPSEPSPPSTPHPARQTFSAPRRVEYVADPGDEKEDAVDLPSMPPYAARAIATRLGRSVRHRDPSNPSPMPLRDASLRLLTGQMRTAHAPICIGHAGHAAYDNSHTCLTNYDSVRAAHTPLERSCFHLAYECDCVVPTLAYTVDHLFRLTPDYIHQTVMQTTSRLFYAFTELPAAPDGVWHQGEQRYSLNPDGTYTIESRGDGTIYTTMNLEWLSAQFYTLPGDRTLRWERIATSGDLHLIAFTDGPPLPHYTPATLSISEAIVDRQHYGPLGFAEPSAIVTETSLWSRVQMPLYSYRSVGPFIWIKTASTTPVCVPKTLVHTLAAEIALRRRTPDTFNVLVSNARQHVRASDIPAQSRPMAIIAAATVAFNLNLAQEAAMVERHVLPSIGLHARLHSALSFSPLTPWRPYNSTIVLASALLCMVAACFLSPMQLAYRFMTYVLGVIGFALLSVETMEGNIPLTRVRLTSYIAIFFLIFGQALFLYLDYLIPRFDAFTPITFIIAIVMLVVLFGPTHASGALLMMSVPTVAAQQTVSGSSYEPLAFFIFTVFVVALVIRRRRLRVPMTMLEPGVNVEPLVDRAVPFAYLMGLNTRVSTDVPQFPGATIRPPRSLVHEHDLLPTLVRAGIVFPRVTPYSHCSNWHNERAFLRLRILRNVPQPTPTAFNRRRLWLDLNWDNLFPNGPTSRTVLAPTPFMDWVSRFPGPTQRLLIFAYTNYLEGDPINWYALYQQSAFVKIEKNPKDGKPRGIQAASPLINALNGPYTHAMQALVQTIWKADHFIAYSPGMNSMAHSSWFTSRNPIARRMIVSAADYELYDTTMRSAAQKLVLYIFFRLFADPSWLQRLHDHLKRYGRTHAGATYSGVEGVGSGNTTTTLVNTVYNGFESAYVHDLIGNYDITLPLQPPDRQPISIIIGGDDNYTLLPEDGVSPLPSHSLDAGFSIVYEPLSSPLVATFLSARFVPCDVDGQPGYPLLPQPGRILARFGWLNRLPQDYKYKDFLSGNVLGLRDLLHFPFVGPYLRATYRVCDSQHPNIPAPAIQHSAPCITTP
jgi:hypothetical protein